MHFIEVCLKQTAQLIKHKAATRSMACREIKCFLCAVFPLQEVTAANEFRGTRILQATAQELTSSLPVESLMGHGGAFS